MGCRVFVGVGGVVALGLAARLGSGKEVPLCKASGHRLAARFQVGRLPLRPLISPTATYVRRCLQAHARTCRGPARGGGSRDVPSHSLRQPCTQHRYIPRRPSTNLARSRLNPRTCRLACNATERSRPRSRWSFIFGSRMRQEWGIEEIAQLARWVGVYGADAWFSVANEMPGRTVDQCRKRWTKNAQTKRASFSVEDDLELLRRVAAPMSSWAAIAKDFVGTSGTDIHTRWVSLMRRSMAPDGSSWSTPEAAVREEVLSKARKKAQQRSERVKRAEDQKATSSAEDLHAPPAVTAAAATAAAEDEASAEDEPKPKAKKARKGENRWALWRPDAQAKAKAEVARRVALWGPDAQAKAEAEVARRVVVEGRSKELRLTTRLEREEEEATVARQKAVASVERLQREDEAMEQQSVAHAAELQTFAQAGRFQEMRLRLQQLITEMPSASSNAIRRMQDAVGPAIDTILEMTEVAIASAPTTSVTATASTATVAAAPGTTTATTGATTDAEGVLRWLLPVTLHRPTALLLPKSGTATYSNGHAVVSAALDTRLYRRTRVKEALRSIAAAAGRAALQAAMMAAAEQSGTPREEDTLARRAFDLQPARECYPHSFRGEEMHSEAECNAVSRAIALGFMDPPGSMQPGVAALYTKLPVEEQHQWSGRREFLRAQRASVIRITGEEATAELLDRASRLQFAMLYNERLTYFGEALFHAYARCEIYPSRLIEGDVMQANTFENRIQSLLRGGMQIGELFSLNQCQQVAKDKPCWSVAVHLRDCDVLISAVISLTGHLLGLSEVGALVHDLLMTAFPLTFDRELSTASLTAASSGFRSAAVVPLHRLVMVVNGVIQPRAPLEDLEEEVDEMVSQLSAPSLYSRVTSTPGGRAQTAAVAHAQGGRMQQWIAGDLLGSAEDVERRRIAEMSTAHRSTTSSEVQYIDHPRPLQNDAIANMAMTVRAGERMGSRHGVQRHELPPQWRHRRELPPSAAAGPAVAGLAAMAGDETVAEAEPASAVATAARCSGSGGGRVAAHNSAAARSARQELGGGEALGTRTAGGVGLGAGIAAARHVRGASAGRHDRGAAGRPPGARAGGEADARRALMLDRESEQPSTSSAAMLSCVLRCCRVGTELAMIRLYPPQSSDGRAKTDT